MENKSGIRPVEYKVLIKPEKVKEKAEDSLIIMPDTVREKEQFSVTKGQVVAVSPMAFTNPEWLDPPKVGDTVYFDKYGNGAEVEGADGETYWLMHDKKIAAVIEVEA